jgi:hypothetical protein
LGSFGKTIGKIILFLNNSKNGKMSSVMMKLKCGRKMAFLVAVCTIVLSTIGRAQEVICNPQTPLAAAICTGCTPITGSTNVNNGDVFCFSGTSLSIGNLNISSGGTVLICSGTLTVGSMAYNGGNIVVNPGATLIVGTSSFSLTPLSFEGITNYGTIEMNTSFNLNNNQYLLNYGTFTHITTDFNINGGNTQLHNSEGAIMNLRTISLDGGANLINGGELNISQTLRINANSTLCLLKCSVLNTVNIANNNNFSVKVGPNPASPCIFYSGDAQMNAQLSGSSRLTVNRAPGATISGGASVPFGFAQVIDNSVSCQATLNACGTLLPLIFQNFDIAKRNNNVHATWAMASDLGIASCSLEGSANGITYTTIKTWHSSNTAYNETLPATTYCMFRIKATTITGASYYSTVQSVGCQDEKRSFHVVNASARQGQAIELRFLMEAEKTATISIADALGRTWQRIQMTLPKGMHNKKWDLSGIAKTMPGGVYFVIAHFNDGQTFSQKIIL